MFILLPLVSSFLSQKRGLRHRHLCSVIWGDLEDSLPKTNDRLAAIPLHSGSLHWIRPHCVCQTPPSTSPTTRPVYDSVSDSSTCPKRSRFIWTSIKWLWTGHIRVPIGFIHVLSYVKSSSESSWRRRLIRLGLAAALIAFFSQIVFWAVSHPGYWRVFVFELHSNGSMSLTCYESSPGRRSAYSHD